MNVWISGGRRADLPRARAGLGPRVVRMPCARLAVANVFAAASVAGFVMTSISSPQRPRMRGQSPRIASPVEERRRSSRRCGRSHGDSSWSLNLCDPPSKATVTSTELRTLSCLRGASYCAAGDLRLASVTSRDWPRITPSAAVGRLVAALAVVGAVDQEGRRRVRRLGDVDRRAAVDRLGLRREHVDAVDRVRGRVGRLDLERRALGHAERLGHDRDAGRPGLGRRVRVGQHELGPGPPAALRVDEPQRRQVDPHASCRSRRSGGSSSCRPRACSA